MRRPARAEATRSLRWSMEVEPSWVEMTSSAAWSRSSGRSDIFGDFRFLLVEARRRRGDAFPSENDVDDLMDLRFASPGTGMGRARRAGRGVALADSFRHQAGQ